MGLFHKAYGTHAVCGWSMQRVLPPVHVPISCLLYSGEMIGRGPVLRAPVFSHPARVPCCDTNIELLIVAVPKDYYCCTMLCPP